MKTPNFIKKPFKKLANFQNADVINNQEKIFKKINDKNDYILKRNDYILKRIDDTESNLVARISELEKKISGIYSQLNVMFFALYKNDNEKLASAKKRFFRSLEQTDPNFLLKQDALYILLKKLVNVCETNNIIYWITFGTLLGAVRHNDFVPWDDDVDIAMPEKEIEKFIKIISQENDFSINYTYVPYLGTRIPRLIFKNHPNIGYIDIYPQTEIHCDQSTALKLYREAKISLINEISSTEWFNYCKYDFDPTKIEKRIVESIDAIIAKQNKIFCSKLEKQSANKSITGYIYSIYNITVADKNRLIFMPIEDVLPIKKIKFRNLSVNSINNYEKYLLNWYYDYFSLPNDMSMHSHIKKFFSDKEIDFIKKSLTKIDI